MKKLFLALSLCLFFVPQLASALNFNITYDASVLNSTNSAQIQSAFAIAAQTFSDLYTNVATVNLTVYWGWPFGGGINLGRSRFQLTGSSYSEVTNLLWTHRASAVDTNSVASLPATDPTGGGSWFVPLPEARVLGIWPTSDGTEDGEIGFATNVNYTFDPNNRSVSSKFDFIGVAQHELSEVLGRANGGFSGGVGFVPYDLFRFTSIGVRSLDFNSTTNAYFSIDNGVTALKPFYPDHLTGDIQDWKSTNAPDAFDALVSSGHINPLSTNDFTAMDVLGYNGLRFQPPHLYEAKTNANVFLRFVNSPELTFTVLATTNISIHESNWTALGAATQGTPGQFTFTDTTATNGLRFYSVRSP